MDKLTYAYEWAKSRNAAPKTINSGLYVWWYVDELPNSIYIKVRKGMYDSEEKAYEALGIALDELKMECSIK